MSNMQVEIKIIDLPKGYPDWIYKPTRPTEFWVIRQLGNLRDVVPEKIRCDMVQPLILHIGDTVCFEQLQGIPAPIRDLYSPTSAHPPYAVLNLKSLKTKSNKQKEVVGGKASTGPIFVG